VIWGKVSGIRREQAVSVSDKDYMVFQVNFGRAVEYGAERYALIGSSRAVVVYQHVAVDVRDNYFVFARGDSQFFISVMRSAHRLRAMRQRLEARASGTASSGLVSAANQKRHATHYAVFVFLDVNCSFAHEKLDLLSRPCIKLSLMQHGTSHKAAPNRPRYVSGLNMTLPAWYKD